MKVREEGNVPIRVMVPAYAWPTLKARAVAAGFTSATAFVESVAMDLALGSESTECVLDLHHRGRTNKQIAEATGLTISAIRDKLNAAGLRSNRAVAP